MMVEGGAKSAFIPPDKTTFEWLKKHTGTFPDDSILPDRDAGYKRMLLYNLEQIVPNVAFPHSPANVKKISDMEKVTIDQAFIGTCTGGRLEDIRIAASIVGGKRVAEMVRLLISPNSRQILHDASEAGYIDILLDSGAVILPPGCGPCAGIHQGLIASGEACISSGSRNYKGRMGSNEARIFLASPAVVAASAIKGKITEPREYL